MDPDVIIQQLLQLRQGALTVRPAAELVLPGICRLVLESATEDRLELPGDGEHRFHLHDVREHRGAGSRQPQTDAGTGELADRGGPAGLPRLAAVHLVDGEPVGLPVGQRGQHFGSGCQEGVRDDDDTAEWQFRQHPIGAEHDDLAALVAVLRDPGCLHFTLPMRDDRERRSDDDGTLAA